MSTFARSQLLKDASIRVAQANVLIIFIIEGEENLQPSHVRTRIVSGRLRANALMILILKDI